MRKLTGDDLLRDCKNLNVLNLGPVNTFKNLCERFYIFTKFCKKIINIIYAFVNQAMDFADNVLTFA